MMHGCWGRIMLGRFCPGFVYRVRKFLLLSLWGLEGRVSLRVLSAVRKRSSQRVKLNPCHVCCDRRLIINSGTLQRGGFILQCCCLEGLLSCLLRGSKSKQLPPRLWLNNHLDVGFGCVPWLAGRRFCIFVAFLWMDVWCLCPVRCLCAQHQGLGLHTGVGYFTSVFHWPRPLYLGNLVCSELWEHPSVFLGAYLVMHVASLLLGTVIR